MSHPVLEEIARRTGGRPIYLASAPSVAPWVSDEMAELLSRKRPGSDHRQCPWPLRKERRMVREVAERARPICRHDRADRRRAARRGRAGDGRRHSRRPYPRRVRLARADGSCGAGAVDRLACLLWRTAAPRVALQRRAADGVLDRTLGTSVSFRRCRAVYPGPR